MSLRTVLPAHRSHTERQKHYQKSAQLASDRWNDYFGKQGIPPISFKLSCLKVLDKIKKENLSIRSVQGSHMSIETHPLSPQFYEPRTHFELQWRWVAWSALNNFLD